MFLNTVCRLITLILVLFLCDFQIKAKAHVTNCETFSNSNSIEDIHNLFNNHSIFCKATLNFPNTNFFSAQCKYWINKSNLYALMLSSDTNLNYNRSLFVQEIIRASLVCTSPLPMYISVQFQEDDPQAQYTNIKQGRVIREDNNTKSYLYKLELSFPHDSSFVYYTNRMVKYIIYNSDRLESEVKILFAFLLFDGSSPYISLFHGKSPIETTTEIIVVRCLSIPSLKDGSENEVSLKRVIGKPNEDDDDMGVESQSLSYDPMEGFRLNTTFLNYTALQGEYRCSGTSSVFLAATEFQIFPRALVMYMEGPKYNILEGKMETGELILSVSSNSRNISLRLLEHNINKSKTLVNISYNSYTIENPERRFVSSAKIPYLIGAERLKYTGWSDDSNPTYLIVRIDNLDTKLTSYSDLLWGINYDENPLRYSEKHKVFICEDLRILDVKSHQPLSLRQWHCTSLAQCKIVAENCLIQENTGKVPAFFNKTTDSCMKAILDTNTQSCLGIGLAERNHRYQYCEVIRPAKQGIIQCSTYSFYSRLITDIRFNIEQTYFEGFDGKMYVNIDKPPPLDATLKIESLKKKEEAFYTRAQYNFECEAHTFFFEFGIQWFLMYLNGSVEHLPQTTTPEVVFESNDNLRNPKSNIIVTFLEKNVDQIICSAPVINTNKWQNISMNLEIFESVPPKFTAGKTDVYLSVEEKGQSISCQSGGLPHPEVKWSKLNKNVDLPLKVLDESSLFFPSYNESFSGEYVCTATNVAGTARKIFSIRTKTEKTFYMEYSLLGVGLFIISFIFLLLILYYKNKQKNKHQEMKDIIRMLNGIEPQDDESSTTDDPLQAPFDTSFEIERNSFFIDRKHLLGKGEFGEVYKGVLEGVEGPVAFKIVDSSFSVKAIKALVYELKILMYIGEHDNVVKLIGAYRKEIHLGSLYVAMELCGLGSLQSYIRSYKHLFLKDINFQNQNKYDTIKIESKREDSFSFHKMKNLSKWSGQIACGMEFLGSKNVVHSDLATRNVLLTVEGIAKVTDFGLSRRMYKYSEYVKTANDPLPWRWLALESILTNTFSSKSDVWSFGVTLWEIFSLGDVPYPTISYSQDFVQQLENGFRMAKPKYASEDIYEIMIRCWNFDPNKRPTFASLKMVFQNCISEKGTSLQRKKLFFEDFATGASDQALSEYLELDDV